MPNLRIAQHLHPHPTIHADPPSGGSTWTEPDPQRHPYTNKAKEQVMPNSKIPTQTQKWATHHFGEQPLPIPHTTTTTILHLPNYTASSQIKNTQPIVRIPSQFNIHADHPPGVSTWMKPVIQRHPYTNESKVRIMPN
jgi:hypothetical protein